MTGGRDGRPLLLPLNDILPPEVRGVHMLEIIGSNFIFGVIAAFLLVRRVPSPSMGRLKSVPPDSYNRALTCQSEESIKAWY